MAEAIQDSKSQDELSEALSLIASSLLCTVGHRTFPDRQLNKDLVGVVSRAFRDKVQEMVSEKPKEQRREARTSVLKYVVDVTFDSIYESIKGKRIGSAGVKIFLIMTQEMLRGYKGLNKQSFT